MKRTQQRVLLASLLAFSLAACSYMPWRNTSGTTPATQPSSAAPTSSATPSTDSGQNTARASANASEPSSHN